MGRIGKYTIKEDKESPLINFHANLVATNGKILISLTKENPTQGEAETEIELVKRIGVDANNYHKQIDKDNKPYWNLMHGDNIIGKTESFNGDQALFDNRKSCIKNCVTEKVVNL